MSRLLVASAFIATGSIAAMLLHSRSEPASTRSTVAASSSHVESLSVGDGDLASFAHEQITRAEASVDESPDSELQIVATDAGVVPGRFSGRTLFGDVTLGELWGSTLTAEDVPRACYQIRRMEQELFQESVDFYGDLGSVSLDRESAETAFRNGALILKGSLPGADASLVRIPCPDHLLEDLDELRAAFVYASNATAFADLMARENSRLLSRSHPGRLFHVEYSEDGRGITIVDEAGKIVASGVSQLPGAP